MGVFDRQSISAAIKAIEATGNFKVLKTVEGHVFPQVDDRGNFAPGDLQVGAIVDTETTGPDHGNDLLQLSMIKFTYLASTGEVVSIDGHFNQFNDPGYPIPQEIIALTGITDDMVAGKAVDMEALQDFIQGIDLTVAHKASYDRMVVEQSFSSLRDEWINTRWACSLQEIDWKALGFGSAKLDYLLFKHGYTYDAHQADVDCKALLLLLTLQHDGKPLLKSLHDSSAQDSHDIWAVGAKFDAKDQLKARGYQWNDGVTTKFKAWKKSVSASELAEELEFLKTIYMGNGEPVIETQTAYTRYSVLADGPQPSRTVSPA
ncbi:3'-5' exonuclease [Methylobacillus sp. Pita2]|uniref:3'-5' exonuclease n=1 Tax=Methylobacillus sp. Pita2 TaxID=3383245 RepID=UPI0038B5778A